MDPDRMRPDRKRQDRKRQDTNTHLAKHTNAYFRLMLYLRIMSINLQVFATKGNDFTLFNPELNETYHSRNGAVAESLHVFIKEGLTHYTNLYPEKRTIRILEVGFGTGLNAILTHVESLKNGYHILYDSLETHILSTELVSTLQYQNILDTRLKDSFEQMHTCEWNKPKQIGSNFTLTKYLIKLQEFTKENLYDLVYFDAFAPEKQPEMWTEFSLANATRALLQGGCLVTYSAKGEVKRTLSALGMDVARIQGPPFKRHMLRATKR
jgi:tRNA U34 5-methylaminomethyl-2-thiouridine-forming methyltransferase MnmC